MTQIKKCLLTLVISCLSSSFSISVNADDKIHIPNVGLLLRTHRVPVHEIKPQRAHVKLAEQESLGMKPDSYLRVDVKQFIFNGNTQYSNEKLQALLSVYMGRTLTFDDLQAAAELIQKYYQDNGYLLAYAYLPINAIQQGTVEITLLEGRIGDLEEHAIRLVDEGRISKEVIQKILSIYSPNEILTKYKIDLLNALLNNLPGISSKVSLLPGNRIGSHRLSIDVKEDPIVSGGNIRGDNMGLYATGYYRFMNNVSINDPFGFGDQLNIRSLVTETGATVAGWADYSILINGYGTRWGVSFSQLNYSLERSFTYLGANGLIRSVGTNLSHPLYLTEQARLLSSAYYEHRWVVDNIGLYASSNNREMNIMHFAFDGKLHDTILSTPEGSDTQANITISVGEVGFPDSTAFINDKNSINSNGGYHKFNWQISRTHNLPAGLSFYTNFVGQIVSKNTDNSEDIYIGGPDAVRAYSAGSGDGDEGWYFNGEGRYSLPNFNVVPGYFQFIGFIDTGYVRVNKNPLPSQQNNSNHLTGYGFGINWLNAKGFNIHTSLAWRGNVDKISNDPNETGSGPQAFFQLSKGF